MTPLILVAACAVGAIVVGWLLTQIEGPAWRRSWQQFDRYPEMETIYDAVEEREDR